MLVVVVVNHIKLSVSAKFANPTGAAPLEAGISLQLSLPSSLQPPQRPPPSFSLLFTVLADSPPVAQRGTHCGGLRPEPAREAGSLTAAFQATLVEAGGEGKALWSRQAFPCNTNCLEQPQYKNQLQWIWRKRVQTFNKSRHGCHILCWKKAMVKKGCFCKNKWKIVFQLHAVLDEEESALAWALQRRPVLPQPAGNVGSCAGG